MRSGQQVQLLPPQRTIEGGGQEIQVVEGGQEVQDVGGDPFITLASISSKDAINHARTLSSYDDHLLPHQ
jgi:hypothetical protein